MNAVKEAPMAGPTLSIITVSKNAEKQVTCALSSVAQQTPEALAEVEHWLIDGASIDSTVEIAKSFPHVKIDSQRDSGISDAFNRGVDRAGGQWILYLNSDDALADEKVLEDILPELKKAADQGIEIVYGRLDIVDLQTKRTLRTGGRDQAWTQLHQRMTLSHPATFMTRSYFEKYGKFDLSFKIAMDYELLLRGCRHSKFKFIDRVITKFSAGGVSMTRAGWRQANECLRAKIKNGVAPWPSRVAWWAYQGTRWTIESHVKQTPGLSKILGQVAGLVDRGY
jgi:glycosyltransferase involved in cell wall biosynthesis